MARNQIIDFDTDPLAELMSADPSKRTEMINDLSVLSSGKIRSHEADIEKIINMLMGIIRDKKESIAEERPSEPALLQETVGLMSDSPFRRQRSKGITRKTLQSNIVRLQGCSAPRLGTLCRGVVPLRVLLGDSGGRGKVHRPTHAKT